MRAPQRQLRAARPRDLTRYPKKLVEERAHEAQRVQKVLEDGKSAPLVLDALMAGDQDVEAMADMAIGRTRPRIGELRLASEGRFDEHHALMPGMHFAHIDHLTASIERLDGEVQRLTGPFAEQIRRLCTIPASAGAPCGDVYFLVTNQSCVFQVRLSQPLSL